MLSFPFLLAILGFIYVSSSCSSNYSYSSEYFLLSSFFFLRYGNSKSALELVSWPDDFFPSSVHNLPVFIFCLLRELVSSRESREFTLATREFQRLNNFLWCLLWYLIVVGPLHEILLTSWPWLSLIWLYYIVFFYWMCCWPFCIGCIHRISAVLGYKFTDEQLRCRGQQSCFLSTHHLHEWSHCTFLSNFSLLLFNIRNFRLNIYRYDFWWIWSFVSVYRFIQLIARKTGWI